MPNKIDSKSFRKQPERGPWIGRFSGRKFRMLELIGEHLFYLAGCNEEPRIQNSG